MRKTFKNEIGITLIALVITIIILIILAGVSINLTIGEEGIITRTKQAKENMEIAINEEEKELAELVNELNTNVNLTTIKTIQELRDTGIYVTSKTTAKDSNGNLIQIPKGFKIAKDSGLNVTEGIVIEDKDIIEGVGNNRGNQYVWIPVGDNIKKSDGTTVDITLGRYVFADGTKNKDEEGTVLERGTPILKQSAENYEDETAINIKEINPANISNYEYKELNTNRAGVVSSDLTGENATALNLKGFIDSVSDNGGYYIARYEASYGVDGKANSKISNNFNDSWVEPTQEGYLWNIVTQVDAAIASRELYSTINSDLINSYAWDTAIVYVQSFSECTNYSYQNSKNITLANTGVNGDEVCKINDMSSNTNEWTTEYCSYTNADMTRPCTYRGGAYSDSSRHANFRNGYASAPSNKNGTFRTILYM